MFKRFRNNRTTIEPPPPPSIEEIFSDLETFQMEDQINYISKRNSETTKDQQWWQDFELFAEGHKNLKVLESEICISEDKLEKYKTELESKTAAMKKEISIQKTQINDVSN